MKNKPITSKNYGKLLIFTLFILVSVVVFVGVIPLIFLIFFLYMTKRSGDFSYIETAGLYIRTYFHLAGIILVLIAIVNYSVETNSHTRADYVGLGGGALLAWIFYIFLVNNFFLKSLREHSEWIVEHGLLPPKNTNLIKKRPNDSVEVMGSENFKSYSVADELLKWAKLKDDGHISEVEFNRARDKILNK